MNHQNVHDLDKRTGKKFFAGAAIPGSPALYPLLSSCQYIPGLHWRAWHDISLSLCYNRSTGRAGFMPGVETLAKYEIDDDHS
jgi:hypothetical protein